MVCRKNARLSVHSQDRVRPRDKGHPSPQPTRCRRKPWACGLCLARASWRRHRHFPRPSRHWARKQSERSKKRCSRRQRRPPAPWPLGHGIPWHHLVAPVDHARHLNCQAVPSCTQPRRSSPSAPIPDRGTLPCARLIDAVIPGARAASVHAQRPLPRGTKRAKHSRKP